MALPLKDEIEERVFTLALQNAVRYGGKARVDPVLAKLIRLYPSIRQHAREYRELVERIVEKVNQLSLEEQRRLLEERGEIVFEKREGRVGLPPLPNVTGPVRTRMAPNPDFVLHLGSARAAILSHDYARMYNGQFILRFEDTDPRTKPPQLEYYKVIEEDLLWLGCRWDEKYYQSDRMELYYDIARQLIALGGAYVCLCPPEQFRSYIRAEKPCPDRNLPPEVHNERFDKMLSGEYGEGEAVLRIKTDLHYPNPAVRDWAGLRIIDTEKHPHPRTGSRYVVWPLYNFACAIDDHVMRITHIIRGKEHVTNEEKQRFLYQWMGWEYPTTIHHGRLGIEGVIMSKSKMLKGLKEGLYKSWDDPRLVTLAALRRRGFTPDAIRDLIYEVGIKPSDAMISWSKFCAINKKHVEPSAYRIFFVNNPLPLHIKWEHPMLQITIPFHPEHTKLGSRSFTIPAGNELSVFVDLNDLSLGDVVRLMGFINVKIVSISETRAEAVFHSKDVSEAKKQGARIIQWVPVHDHLSATVVMPDASERKGVIEPSVVKLGVSTVVQLVRFGFARIDSTAPVVLYYAHS